MGEEAKKILADNNRMFEELKFHHAESSENQADKVCILLFFFKIKQPHRRILVLEEQVDVRVEDGPP